MNKLVLIKQVELVISLVFLLLQYMPDFTAPKVPTINKVTDATKNVIGKAEAKAKVTLYINDKRQGTKTADKAGNYKFLLKSKA